MLQAPTDKALMRMLDECAKGIPTHDARDVLSFFRSQGVYDLKGVSQLTRQDIDAMVQEGCNTPVFDGMEGTALKSHISALTTQAQTRLDENAQSQKLYDAANDGRTADVLELIRNQTNIDAHVYPNVGGYEHPDGVSVLMVASFRGYDDIVRILCENAAHIDDVGKVRVHNICVNSAPERVQGVQFFISNVGESVCLCLRTFFLGLLKSIRAMCCVMCHVAHTHMYACMHA